MKPQEKETPSIRLGDVIIDPSYQCRTKINKYKIGEYYNVIKTKGYNPFPPIVIEEETNKVICGFTRMEAYMRLYDPDDTVPAIFASFKTVKERRIFSIRDNNHGEPLSSWDKDNLISLLYHDGATAEEISKELALPINRIEKIAGIFLVESKHSKHDTHNHDGKQKGLEKKEESKKEDRRPRKAAIAMVSGNPMPLKGGLQHLDGEKVSKKVYRNISEHYTGWNDCFLISQIRMRIDDKTINLNDEKVMAEFEQLFEKMTKVLGKQCN